MPGERILIIDDDPDMRESVCMILEPAGYQVQGCATGRDGMEKLHAHPPDLILLDIMLGSPSEGFHLAYELARDDQLKDIPIVMISAIGERMGMDYARELGTDYLPVAAFIEKPVTAERLLEVVRRVLSDRRYVRSAPEPRDPSS